jgi:hypothetical protein
MAWVHLPDVFKERFLIGVKEARTIDFGRWWIKDSSKVVARGSSTVVAWGSSKVVAWGSSKVEARDSSFIVLPWGRGNLKSIHDKSVARDGYKLIVADKSYTLEYV